jgi:hypothetical protein
VVTFKNDTDNDTWIQSETILVGDVTTAGEGTSYYGNDVAIHDDTLIVGSPFEGVTGVIYIYHWWEGDIGWNLQHKITGPMPGDNDWYHSMFGWSMDMHDDILIVGAPGASTTDGIKRAGSVFIFTDILFTKPQTSAPTPDPTPEPTSSPTPTPTPEPSTPSVHTTPAPVSITPLPSTAYVSMRPYMITTLLILVL